MNNPVLILYLEDNPRDAELVRDKLQQAAMAHELRVARDRAEYEAALAQTRFDLILSDYALPDYDGMAALALAREKQPDVPFILVSGTLGEERAVDCMVRGATDYVLKQNLNRLVPAVLRALTEAEEHQKRRVAEAAVRASEEKYRALFETSRDALMTLEPPTWAFTSGNPATVKMFGAKDEAEFISYGPEGLSPERQPDGRASAEKAKEMIETAMRDGSHFFEWTHRRIGGENFPADVLLTRMEQAGKVMLQASVRDITERKCSEEDILEANMRLREAMEELNRSQQQVIQQERMKALGEMVSGIAHDFNNNLVPILGFSDFLVSDPHALEDRTDTIELLKMIRTAASDAHETVRRLREFYRPDAELETTEVALPALITKVVELTLPAWKTQAEGAGKMIRMETDVESLPSVMANESQLREVLTNLVFNAVHAMPQGGVLRLIGRAQGTEWVTVSVQDTGVGMTEAVRRRCLEPFFTTKGNQGSGLGLSMCYGIVQRHGGRLEIESEEGKGTTVKISLPLAPPKSAQRVERVDGDSAVRGLRILVVDDDIRSRELIRRCLQIEGQTVVLASSADEAFQAVDTGSFDLVMTDQAMPEMNGDQLAQAIKRKHPSLPIIMLTGFGDMLLLDTATRQNVDLVVGKPTTREKLRQAVAAVMRK